jgi:hypothetical protein
MQIPRAKPAASQRQSFRHVHFGDHFFRTLILENSKSLLDDDSWVWAQLADSPASPLAVPRAVLQISVLFGATPVELEVQQGARRLYTEYMTSIFPPSPLLFGTDFGDIRKKFPKPEAGRETRK